MGVFVGVDATRTPRGLIAVSLLDGHLHEVRLHRSFDELLASVRDADAVVMDLPIGHDDLDGSRRQGKRLADISVHEYVGPRAADIPLVPPFILLTADSLEDACTLAEGKGWPAPTKRLWVVRDRVLHLQDVIRDHPNVHEGRSEVSFRRLLEQQGGGGHLQHPPHYWSGLHERLVLLHEVGLRPTRSFGGIGRMNPEDVVAATAMAWTAARIAARDAQALPADAPESAPRIWS